MHQSEFIVYSRNVIPPGLDAYLRRPFIPPTDDEVLEPARKRRKVSALKESRLKADEERWADCLTLARVNIYLNFESQAANVSHTERSHRELTDVHIKEFDRLSDGGYRCALRASTQSIETFELDATVGDETFDVLQLAASLYSSNNKSYCKAICSIRQSEEHLKPLISTTPTYILEVRIVWRNAQSLAEARCDKQNDLLVSLTAGTMTKSSDGWCPRDFYDSVHVPDKENKEAEALEVSGLGCHLFPFQKRTIHWLMKREGVDLQGKPIEPDLSLTDLPHGFFRMTDLDGRTVFVNHWLGIVTTHECVWQEPGTRVRGGILAEEMGLGKTVEMISLILLHRRKLDQNAPQIKGALRTSGSTLIVAPNSILQQWESEIRMHAPGLKVMVYEGIRSASKKTLEEEIVNKLMEHDIVLSTYNVLAGEIHFAGTTPERSLRYEKQYRRKLSPLVQINWWRVLLDEAQMVESGVSNAAQVVLQIPRYNAWAVSGTPLKKDAKDLLGLLTFLRLEPYYYSTKLWNRLTSKYKSIFQKLFGDIALRHTKEQVKRDIQLPPQKRIVITMPFTQIEEQYYSNLYQEMCEDCGLDLDGAPLTDDWNSDDPAVIEKMRSWLSRLRQVCLHPEVGGRNRKALGGDAPLRTIAEVLRVMMEQNDITLRTEERAYFISQLKRGQLHEHAGEPQKALEIWLLVQEQARKAVQECRMEYKQAQESEIVELEDDVAGSGRLGVVRLRLRSALEVEHMATFFVANAYYQVKSNAEVTEPESDQFKELERRETEQYEVAKGLRAEMLAETQSKADGHMTTVRRRAEGQDFVTVPIFQPLSVSGGVESRTIIQKIEALFEVLNIQAETLDEWRRKMVELLTRPLVDQEEEELKGDEYETSTKQQEEVYVYMEGLRALVADRRDALTGLENILIKTEMATSLQQATQGNGHAPELMRSLLLRRQALKPTQDMGSLRRLLAELRTMKTILRAHEERGSSRAHVEAAIVNSALYRLQNDLTEQTKAVTELDNEVSLYRDAMNTRLEYYRQLQIISDAVAPLEEDMNETKMIEMDRAEAKSRSKIATLKSRARYLVHLQEDSSDDTQKKCIICQDWFEIGTLTSCGHTYCKECLNLWWKQHNTCPTCKKHLRSSDFHQITYKPQELKMQEEAGASSSQTMSRTSPTSPSSQISRSSSSSKFTPNTIYSGISAATLAWIKNIDLNGSFGTKIDTLARHILWLREHDRGAKSIIFSQFRDFLNVLARAFSKFGIHFASIDKRGGVERFRHDPGVECFFLHARAHASGLNLVNATHVFLVEPLINTALELQAIARVHRIGQEAPTTVWMYLVEGTVEKAIYDISVQRRLEHIGSDVAVKKKGKRRTRGKGAEGDDPDLEAEIEAANSLEMQDKPLARLLSGTKGGGEMVGEEDLWACLFRERVARSGEASVEAQSAITGFLAAEAADRRMERLRR